MKKTPKNSPCDSLVIETLSLGIQEGDWLTIADCAFRLKASWRLISRLADSGRIPCQECNGIRKVRPMDVLAWQQGRAGS